MSGYTPKGDKKAHRAYEEAFEKVSKLSTKGQSIKTEQHDTEQAINDATERVSSAERLLIDLQRQLEDAKSKKRDEERFLASAKEKKSLLVEEEASVLADFNDAREARVRTRDAYLQSIPKPKEADNSYPTALGPAPELLTVHGLGDVHGWAPGLVNYLAKQDLATVSIDGRPTSTSPSGTFPDLSTVTTKGMVMEGQWMDGSTFTPKGGPSDLHHRGAFGRVEIAPGSALKQGFFLQVGDLNDRGDYSELSFVIMRKLALSSGGRAMFLLGNHEEMLLRGNYENWLKNEEKSGEYVSPDEPGSIRIRPDLLGIKDDKSKETYRQSLFFSYSAHFAHLLLTQEYLLRSMLSEKDRDWLIQRTNPALSLTGIDDDRLRELATTESWSTLEACYTWLETMWKKGMGLCVPGGMVVFSIGHVLALHASIKSLGDFLKSKAGREFADRRLKTSSGAEFRIHLFTMPNASKPTEEDNTNQAMLWSRDQTFSRGKPTKVMSAALEELARCLPQIETIFQGHEPVTTQDLAAKIVRVERPRGRSQTLVNLDVGMTPVYLHKKITEKYDLTRVPGGHDVLTYGHEPRLLGEDLSIQGTGHALDAVHLRPGVEITAEIRSSAGPTARIHHLPDGKLTMVPLGRETTIITSVKGSKVNETNHTTLEPNKTYTLARKQVRWLRTYYTPLYQVSRGAPKQDHARALEAYNKIMVAEEAEEKLRREAERKAEAERKEAEAKRKAEEKRKAEAERKAESELKKAQAEQPVHVGLEVATLEQEAPTERKPDLETSAPKAIAPNTTTQTQPLPERPAGSSATIHDDSAAFLPSKPPNPSFNAVETVAESSMQPQTKPPRAHVLIDIENIAKNARAQTDIAKEIVNQFRLKFKHDPQVTLSILALKETAKELEKTQLSSATLLTEHCQVLVEPNLNSIQNKLTMLLKSSTRYLIVRAEENNDPQEPRILVLKPAKFRNKVTAKSLENAVEFVESWRDRP